MPAAPPHPTNELLDPRRWWTLAVLCLSLLIIGLDNTILNVALPTLERDLDASASQLQWIVDAYMLVFAGLLLSAGALGDRFGRKRALTLGIVIFAAGSGLAALASSAGELIAARALMGVGGAFIMPSTLSILTATFPAHERPKAIGIWAAVSGLGIAIGPVLGGWLIENWDWSAVFLVNLPIAVVAVVAGRRLVPESLDPAAPRLDLGGFALSIAGLTTLVWGIIEAPMRGWTDPTILGAFAAAAAILAAFVAWELRAPQPMLDVRLFRNPRFSAASGAISLMFFALFGMLFLLTQYLQAVLGYSPLEAGVRVLPVALGLILASGLSARLLSGAGTKRMVVAGMLLVAAGLSVVTQADQDSGYAVVAVALSLLGLGIGTAMAPATDSIMGSLPLAKASVGSAVNDTTRVAGGALGVAVIGSVVSSGYRGDMESVTGAPAAAQDSLAAALGIARQVGGEAGARLADAAQSAFIGGMHTSALVAAGIALAGAALAAAWLPASAPEPHTAIPEAVPA